jgi:DNA (cytosine-5)-methyltransferase 1
VRHISGGESSSSDDSEPALWPTPSASQANYEEDPVTWLARRETLKEKGINGNGAGMPLGIAAKLWPTPTARDHKIGHRPEAKRSARREGSDGLNDAVRMWPTPTATDGGSDPKKPERAKRSKRGSSSPSLVTAVKSEETTDGALSPTFVEWLMGFPIGWTDLDV